VVGNVQELKMAICCEFDRAESKSVYPAVVRKNKDEMRGSFTSFRMTTSKVSRESIFEFSLVDECFFG